MYCCLYLLFVTLMPTLAIAMPPAAGPCMLAKLNKIHGALHGCGSDLLMLPLAADLLMLPHAASCRRPLAADQCRPPDAASSTQHVATQASRPARHTRQDIQGLPWT